MEIYFVAIKLSSIVLLNVYCHVVTMLVSHNITYITYISFVLLKEALRNNTILMTNAIRDFVFY